MSCASLSQQVVRMTVSAGSLPEGFCPKSIQDMFDAMVQRIIVTPNVQFSSFAMGSLEPTSNVGPWLKDCTTWFVWDDATSRYIPMAFNGGFQNFQVKNTSGTFVVPDFIYRLRVSAWGGGGGGDSGGLVSGGGGGGGFGKSIFTVIPGQVISFMVGVGGGPSIDGSDTTFLTMTAGGGKAGIPNDPSLGGAVTGADFGIQGGTSEHPAPGGLPGFGGSAPQGGSGGAFSNVPATVKINGIAPGGGGSGGYSTFPAGIGANGAIIIEY